ncbi:dnaJ homolog subfamily C member 30, mitochondrial-like isoform X2 [Tigriopus californicus]|uniref:dnaJ homolog subfamily C member 30, mitochondrial-like isoform X2 n=1 Tax=Tigriopus californicus TaxID=6832 RepID=UPI0027DA575C|nr:dnaJ homolog subfamily C member 30, mitochondrial-like isoform X2 [Tigriopus californicus]
MQTCAPHVMWTRWHRSNLRNFASHPPEDSTCPYQVLGLRRNADLKSIKSAYITLSKKYHPDVNASPQSSHQFRAVAEAYQLIGNASAKRRYDAKLASELRQNPYQRHTPSPGRPHPPPPQYRAPPRPPDDNIHRRWEAYLNERLKRSEREEYIRRRRDPFHVPEYGMHGESYVNRILDDPKAGRLTWRAFICIMIPCVP